MKNIVLIGMPGSGKSTTGVVLAKTLGMDFQDTDLLISKSANKTLQNIIDEDGLDNFLKLEEEVGANLKAENFVIATGGSMVLSEKAMQNLKQIATVVYLDVSLNELTRRINNIKSRGIAFKKGETLKDIYDIRTPLYKQYADVVIRNSNKSIEKSIDKIINKLNIKSCN